LKQTILALAVLALGGGSASANIVYTANRAVGTGFVNLSITTDGATGTLTQTNILGWTITVTDKGDTFTLLGPSSGNNSQVRLDGSALTATMTNLSFNYNAGGNQFLLIQSPGIGSGEFFWSVQTNGSFDFSGPAEAIDPRANFSFVREAHSGNLVIASAAVNAAPEPATFPGALIAGLLGLGYAWRRRRARPAT
jgi:hypothetical protein